MKQDDNALPNEARDAAEFSVAFALYAEISEAEKRLDRIKRLRPMTIPEFREQDEMVAVAESGIEQLKNKVELLKPKPARGLKPGQGWIERAREIALEHLRQNKAMDWHPPLGDVSEHVAKEMRSKKMYGPQGKPLSATYIKREALQGDWWRRNQNR